MTTRVALLAFAPACLTVTLAAAPPIVLDRLDQKRFEQVFRRAAEDAVFEHKGKRITKAEIVAQATRAHARRQARKAETQAQAAAHAARVEQVRAEFLKQRETELEARNAAILAEVAKLQAQER